MFSEAWRSYDVKGNNIYFSIVVCQVFVSLLMATSKCGEVQLAKVAVFEAIFGSSRTSLFSKGEVGTTIRLMCSSLACYIMCLICFEHFDRFHVSNL